MSKVVSVGQRLLFLPVLGVLLLVAAAAAPMLWGWKTFLVLGGSMEPTIPLGAAAVVRSAAPGELRTGQVITFLDQRDGRSPVTHRVVAVGRAGSSLVFRTRGDANQAADPVDIPESAVVGRVAYFVPWAGYVLAVANTSGARLLLLILLLVFVGNDLLRKLTSEGQRRFWFASKEVKQ